MAFNIFFWLWWTCDDGFFWLLWLFLPFFPFYCHKIIKCCADKRHYDCKNVNLHQFYCGFLRSVQVSPHVLSVVKLSDIIPSCLCWVLQISSTWSMSLKLRFDLKYFISIKNIMPTVVFLIIVINSVVLPLVYHNLVKLIIL